MKRVLLTGATGFIGRHSIVPLITRGYEVHAVSVREAPRATPDVRWYQADLLEDSQVERLMNAIRPTHLLHFAWYAEPGKFWRSVENFRWLEASIALMRSFRERGGERAVMAGSCAEYDWNCGFCSEGITLCRPATPYGVCKNAMQETLRSYCGETGLSGAWGRVFFLYGPGEHPARLVASVIESLLEGGTARCTHGNQIRDFLHVRDVADAFVAMLDSDVRDAVNIASGKPITVRDIVLAAADCIGGRDRVEFGALRTPVNEPPVLLGDTRRLFEEVGWRPSVEIAAGIAATVRYRQEERKTMRSSP